MKTLAVMALAGMAFASPALARDQIRIVGSSTVFPFTTLVAERLAQGGQLRAPIVESTGTGGGMRLFCGGVGEQHPDITGASRPMLANEFQTCQQNGVNSITEIRIGFDGIVLANSRSAQHVSLTRQQLFQALAKEVEVNGQIVANPYQRWNEIDPSLPNVQIEVLGPPPTSGTRDAWVELVMEQGCRRFPAIEALRQSDRDRYNRICRSMREDGRYIEAGENDNIIVQRLQASPTAFGIFGYSFLEENQNVLTGNQVEGIEPTFENISSGRYPVSRSLYVYVKNQHVGVIPGIREFIAEYTSERAWGPEGYLADHGLIPLPDADRQSVRQGAVNLTAMSAPAAH